MEQINYTEVAQDLRTAKALIDTPEKWTQGEYGRDAAGAALATSEWDTRAPTCMCSVGAIAKAKGVIGYVADRTVATRLLDEIVGTGPSAEGGGIINFNDNHTHAEVMAVWDKAIAKADALAVVQNLETLLAAVEAQPEDQFNLSNYRCESECGTLYCTAGLAATMPYFQALGLGWRKGVWHNFVTVDGKDIDQSEKTAQIFGANAWCGLFAAYACGDYDDEFKVRDGSYNDTMTHKALAVLRLKKRIETLKGEQE